MSKRERKANLTIFQINGIFVCGVNHAFVSPRKLTSCKEDVPSENAVKATLRVTCWHQIDHHCIGRGAGGGGRGQGGGRVAGGGGGRRGTWRFPVAIIAPQIIVLTTNQRPNNSRPARQTQKKSVLRRKVYIIAPPAPPQLGQQGARTGQKRECKPPIKQRAAPLTKEF